MSYPSDSWTLNQFNELIGGFRDACMRASEDDQIGLDYCIQRFTTIRNMRFPRETWPVPTVCVIEMLPHQFDAFVRSKCSVLQSPFHSSTSE